MATDSPAHSTPWLVQCPNTVLSSIFNFQISERCDASVLLESTLPHTSQTHSLCYIIGRGKKTTFYDMYRHVHITTGRKYAHCHPHVYNWPQDCCGFLVQFLHLSFSTVRVDHSQPACSVGSSSRPERDLPSSGHQQVTPPCSSLTRLSPTPKRPGRAQVRTCSNYRPPHLVAAAWLVGGKQVRGGRPKKGYGVCRTAKSPYPHTPPHFSLSIQPLIPQWVQNSTLPSINVISHSLSLPLSEIQ